MKYVALPGGDIYEMTNTSYRRLLEFLRSGGDYADFKKFGARYLTTPMNLQRLTREDARDALIDLNTKD